MKIENLKINKLLQLGKPEHQPWINYIHEYDFNNDDVSDLISVLLDKDLHNSYSDTSEVWAPVHAWRVLGQLKSEQAIPSLIECFDFLYDDDWALNEFHKVFAMIGPVAIPALDAYFKKEVDDEFSRVMAMDALCEIALIHSEYRDQVIGIYQNYMQAPEKSAYNLNGLLMGRLLDLNAKEVIEDIRKLFSLGCVDECYVGDLEDVEMELGLRTQRTTPRLGYAFYRESNDSLEDIADEEFGFDDGVRYTVSEPFVRDAPKIGRNDPCYCGSLKKYKKCCGMN